jgi:hypothetical protein
MPLHVEGGFCPVVLCDHCGDLITEASASRALWLQSSGAKPGSHRVYFIHNTCTPVFEQTAFTEMERSQVLCADLAAFLIHLSANTGVASEPQTRARLFERISSQLAKAKLQRSTEVRPNERSLA